MIFWFKQIVSFEEVQNETVLKDENQQEDDEQLDDENINNDDSIDNSVENDSQIEEVLIEKKSTKISPKAKKDEVDEVKYIYINKYFTSSVHI